MWRRFRKRRFRKRICGARPRWQHGMGSVIECHLTVGHDGEHFDPYLEARWR